MHESLLFESLTTFSFEPARSILSTAFTSKRAGNPLKEMQSELKEKRNTAPSESLRSRSGLIIYQPRAACSLLLSEQLLKTLKDVISDYSWKVSSFRSWSSPLPFVQGATMDLCVCEYCICPLEKFVFSAASSFLPDAAVSHLRVYCPLYPRSLQRRRWRHNGRTSNDSWEPRKPRQSTVPPCPP